MSHMLVRIEAGEPVRLPGNKDLPVLIIGDNVDISAPSMPVLRDFLRAALTAVDGEDAVACAMSDLAILQDTPAAR